MSYRLLENSRPPVCKKDGLLCLIRSPLNESQLGRVFQAHKKMGKRRAEGQSLSVLRRLEESTCRGRGLGFSLSDGFPHPLASGTTKPSFQIGR